MDAVTPTPIANANSSAIPPELADGELEKPDLKSPLPERFKPEPLLFAPDFSEDFFTAPAPQPSPQPFLPPPAAPSPAESAPVPPRYDFAVYVWTGPFVSPLFVPTPEQFWINSGRRMPGIAYGSDVLWMEGWCTDYGSGPLTGGRCR